MKKSKQCLKCESLRVVWYATSALRHHNDTVTYLCVDCGFYEKYRRFPEDLLAHLEYEESYKDRFGWVNPQPGEQGPYR
jgi:RNase P subunit RPR2